MIVRTLLAALVAGLIAGVFMTAAQQYRVVPLILHAEQFEGGHEEGPIRHPEVGEAAPALQQMTQLLSPVTPAMAHDGSPHFIVDRFSGTLMANLVTGAGFALLLAAVSIFTGVAVTVSNAVLWGMAGWMAIQLLPAIGLPPELPGMPAGDLGARQVWWVGACVLSAAGIYLLALRHEVWAKLGGLVLIAVPHAVGAPQPSDLASAVPAGLAAEYVVAALATTLAFWIVLAFALGYFSERFGRAQ